MAEMKKIATRVSYGNALVELARQGADNLVVFDADLAAATKTEIFRKEYPDRHFDCGIAEQNMIGAAAGMSTMGYVPFVSSFAMFAAGRAFEQIRNTVGYPHLNVKIAATHAGLSVGEDGASHQCCEDIALMRTIPGMVILSPADDVEARAAVIAAYNYNGPVYLRFSRLASPVFHDPDTYEFQIGKGEKLTDGYDIAVIATGLMTSEALRAAVLAKRQGISVRVINMPTIKPLDEEIILTAARECRRIITVEDSAELKLSHENLCRLEARPANVEGQGRVTIRDLVINTLRMRPDRIIVGECRGAEALDMLQAMNTGHDGSMTTCHANNPRDALSRLENMVMMAGFELPSSAIREQIASAIHLIVQQTRLPDGSRKIVKISEVTGREGSTILMQDIFTFEQEGFDEKFHVIGHHTATGNIPKFVDELRQAGDLELDMSVFVPEG